MESLLLLLPLFLTSILITWKPLSLKSFQGVYLIASALWLELNFLLFPEIGMLTPLVTTLLGILVQFLLVGLFGKQIHPSTYASIQVAVGLFPWYLGVGVSITYILFSILLIAIYSTITYSQAKKTFRLKGNKLALFKKQLSEESFKEFKTRASIIIALPISLAGLLTISLFSFK